MLCSWVRMALQSVNFVGKTILVKHQEAKAVFFWGGERGKGRCGGMEVGFWERQGKMQGSMEGGIT